MNMHCHGFLGDCHSWLYVRACNNWPSASSFLAFDWLTAEQVRWSDVILRSGQIGCWLGITNELWVLQIHLTSYLMSIVNHTHMINTRFAIEVCQWSSVIVFVFSAVPSYSVQIFVLSGVWGLDAGGFYLVSDVVTHTMSFISGISVCQKKTGLYYTKWSVPERSTYALERV